MAFSLDLGNLIVHLNMHTDQFDRMFRQTQGHLKTAEQSMTKLGRKMTLGLTVPITAIGVVATKSFSALEDAFIGVQKTVNATEVELQGLKAGFEDLSRTIIPIATTELFGIGEAAGQLGIETQNILAFSETMAQLGVTTNLSSDEAASALARLANITQMPQTSFDRLGATIVDLGNNLATTEAEIVNMALRLAGAGTQIGLTEAEILSLAGALSSVGLRAEQGGTAFSRIMLEMNTAVKNNTRELRTFAMAAGRSQKEFQELFSTDSQKALEEFVLGLARLREEGNDVTPVLEGIGLGGIRVIDVLGRMSGASDVLTRSFQIGDKAWEENRALVEEAEKKFKSFSSQLQITKNHVVLVAGEIGEQLVPYLTETQELIKDGLRVWERLSDETKQTAVSIALVTAAAGPALLVMAKLIGAFSGLLKLVAGLKTAMLALAIPFGGIAGSISVLVGLAYTLRAAWNQGVEGVRENLEAMQEYFANALEWIRNTAIGKFLESAFLGFVQFFKDVRREWKSFVGGLGGMWNVIRSEIKRGIAGVPAKQNQWALDFVEGFDAATEGVDNFTKHVQTQLNIAGNSIKKFTFNTQGDRIEDIPVLMQGVLPAIKERLGQVVAATKIQIKQDFDDLVDFIGEEFPEIQKILDEMSLEIDTFIDVEKTTAEIDKIAHHYENTIRHTINPAIASTKGTWRDLFDEATKMGMEFQSSMESTIETGLMRMMQDFDNFGDHVKQIFKEIYFEAIRIAFIKPLAQNTAGLFMNIGGSVVGAFGGGAAGAGGTAAATGSTGTNFQGGVGTGAGGLMSRHSGQNVAPDELVAKVKKEELIAPEHKVVDLSSMKGPGGGVEINFTNPPGIPLAIREQRTQTIDGKQVVSIMLQALDNDMILRRKTKAVAAGG